jgi:hydrogenase maturation protein HypF
LQQIIADRSANRAIREIARAFHEGLASGTAAALRTLAAEHQVDTVVVSGGVFQNDLLLGLLHDRLSKSGLILWTNRLVPSNDGGISLGQAAIAAVHANFEDEKQLSLDDPRDNLGAHLTCTNFRLP